MNSKGKIGKGKIGKGALIRALYVLETHHIATERHLPYGITQCYLLPETGERPRLNPSHAGRYLIYLPRRDGRPS